MWLLSVIGLAFVCGFSWACGDMLARWLVYRYFSVGYRMAWRMRKTDDT